MRWFLDKLPLEQLKMTMNKEKINVDFLLLLVDKSGLLETTTVNIDKHFEIERDTIRILCSGENDNIDEIINFLQTDLKPKLPNKLFKYCKELDKAYQSVHVNIDSEIKDIIDKRRLIFANQELAIKESKEFNIENEFKKLKNQLRERIELWFKVFDTEFAYDKAKKVSNMKVYSHRISGWSNPEYSITSNLKLQIKTNFGYGSVSYFYSLLTFRNIQITPFSEWIDYRYSYFYEVIRYTRSFRARIPVTDERGRVLYHKTKIESVYWYNAMEFTKNAANLSITNEREFIDKYILTECEYLVNGLEDFYKKTEFEFNDENQVNVEKDEINKYRVDIHGYELIDFRTEKIIGALDFFDKIIEYNTIIPTQEYTQRIFSLCKRFIPNVYTALDNQKTELNKAEKDLSNFMIEYNKIMERNKFYNQEKQRLKFEFWTKYENDYKDFIELYKKSKERLKHFNHKIKLHSDNIEKLTNYISKYNERMGS
jgi:hypothetical protein